MSRDVVVLSAVRSPIGAFGGSLADFDSSELAGIVPDISALLFLLSYYFFYKVAIKSGFAFTKPPQVCYFFFLPR